MNHKAERRKSFRFPLKAEVTCHVNDYDFRGTIRDLSITGLYMNTTGSPTVTSKCRLEVVLRGDHSCLTLHELTGSILRKDEFGVAIQFDNRLEWVALVPIFFHKMQKQQLE